MAPPQHRHHLQFATTIPPVGAMGGAGGLGGGRVTSGSTKKRGGASARERKMSDQQKSERRYVLFCMCMVCMYCCGCCGCDCSSFKIHPATELDIFMASLHTCHYYLSNMNMDVAVNGNVHSF